MARERGWQRTPSTIFRRCPRTATVTTSSSPPNADELRSIFGTITSAIIDTSAPVTDPGNSTVDSALASVAANGTAASTITVTLLDANGVPLVGHTVTLAQDGASAISAASGPSDASGVVTFTVTNTNVEPVTYTATDTDDGLGQGCGARPRCTRQSPCVLLRCTPIS